MIRNILFDVDGTLWDSSQAVTDAWNVVLKKNNIHPITLDQMMHSMGHTMTEIGEMLFGNETAQRQDELMKECTDYENQYLPSHPGSFYPDLIPVLQQLKQQGCHFFIVSNCQDGYIQAMLKSDQALSELIDDFECYGRTRKPKADSILILMKRNHLLKNESVYVGDTAMDEEAASKAGIRFIHASYGFGTAEHPDAVIDNLHQLPDALSSLQ